MGLGVYIYLAWFGVLASSIFLAGFHVARRGLRGAWAGAAAIFGSLMSWAFVSAYIGSVELDGYVGSVPFVVSIAIGLVGVVLIGVSCIGLKRSAGEKKAVAG